MPAMALSRVAARVVESGPGGQVLAAGTWQKLEAPPGPRSPQGRVYPLACLIAIAFCVFTAAGNDRVYRGRAVDQALRGTRWQTGTGRRIEKTIRVVLDRLDPRARAPLGPRPDGPGLDLTPLQ
jgi:hypothetical protein